MLIIKIYTDAWHEVQNASKKVIDPILSEKLNGCGSLTFKVAIDDEYYSDYERLKTKVLVLENDIVQFSGRLLETSKDFYNTMTLTFEGDMAMLNDIQYEPYDYSGTIAGLFNDVLEYYNSRCLSSNQINKGRITVTDNNNYIARSNSDYSSCWEVFSKKLVELCGGYLKMRYVYVDGEITRYLDYLENPGTEATQAIEFGENILDVNQDLTGEDIITVLIPFGAKDEATGERIDITSVNPTGKNFIVSTNYTKFGLVEHVEYWDDVTLPQNLYNKAVSYLAAHDTSGTTITVSAVDLHAVDVEIAKLNCGDTVQVISKPHDIDTYMLINERVKNLNDVSKDTITLGNELKTFTSSVDKNNYGTIEVEGDPVSSVDVLYGLSDSTTEVPTEWSSSAVIEDGKYLWQKTKTTYTSGTVAYSSPSCIGGKGSDGKGISSIIEEYYLSTSQTEQEGGEWTTESVVWESGKYIWTRSHIYWTDSTDTTTTPVLANGLNSMGEKIETVEAEIPTDEHIETITEQQTKLMLGGSGGYLQILSDVETNKPVGIRIMDSANEAEAVNVWLFNKDGLGFSNTGINGPFYNAWTIDGHLSADSLYTGVLSSRDGSFSLDLDSGTLKVTGIEKQISDTNEAVEKVSTDLQSVSAKTSEIEGNYVSQNDTEYKKITTSVTVGDDGVVIKGSTNGSDNPTSLKINSSGVFIQDKSNNVITSMTTNEFRTGKWVLQQTNDNKSFNLFKER